MHTHVFAGVLAGFLFANAATAATFIVSPNGDDAGACGTPAAPCKTLQRAINRADVGGTIILSEPGNYGQATIAKSVNIRGVPGAGIFSPPATQPCLTINGGGSDVITLEGVTCDKDGGAQDGIVFNSGHKLRVENSVIRGATGPNCGLLFAPSSGTDELLVNNSTLTENGTTGTNMGGGICLMPSGSAHVLGVIRNSVMQNGRHGVVANPSGSGTAGILVDGSDLSTNAGGAFFNGNATVCLRNSTLTANTFQALGGTGGRLNGGGNLLWNNQADGTYSGNCP